MLESENGRVGYLWNLDQGTSAFGEKDKLFKLIVKEEFSTLPYPHTQLWIFNTGINRCGRFSVWKKKSGMDA